jgi:hypothetical protein
MDRRFGEEAGRESEPAPSEVEWERADESIPKKSDASERHPYLKRVDAREVGQLRSLTLSGFGFLHPAV